MRCFAGAALRGRPNYRDLLPRKKAICTTRDFHPNTLSAPRVDRGPGRSLRTARTVRRRRSAAAPTARASPAETRHPRRSLASLPPPAGFLRAGAPLPRPPAAPPPRPPGCWVEYSKYEMPEAPASEARLPTRRLAAVRLQLQLQSRRGRSAPGTTGSRKAALHQHPERAGAALSTQHARGRPPPKRLFSARRGGPLRTAPPAPRAPAPQYAPAAAAAAAAAPTCAPRRPRRP